MAARVSKCGRGSEEPVSREHYPVAAQQLGLVNDPRIFIRSCEAGEVPAAETN
jgi:hypothetical protein